MEAFLEEDTKTLRVKIKDRMAEVTENLTQSHVPRGSYIVEGSPATTPITQTQSPSMQRIMSQNPDIIPKPPQPVSAAAAQALAARQALMLSAANEKPEAGRVSKRKI